MSEADHRRFAVASYGEITVIDIPPGMLEAMDILMDDGLTAEKAAATCWAAYRNKDSDGPVAFARHFVKLRKAFNNAPGGVR